MRRALLALVLLLALPAHAKGRKKGETPPPEPAPVEQTDAEPAPVEPAPAEETGAEPAPAVPAVIGPPVRQADGTCLCACDCPPDVRLVEAEDEQDAGTEAGPKKNFRWTPYASPGASPELGALISAGALFSLSLDKDDPDLPRSSITAALTFSTTGAILFSVLPTFYLPHDKVRISANMYFKDMPDNYWGVGYQQGTETVQGPDTTAYDKLWWQFNPKVVVQVKPNLFVGGLLDLNQTIATNMSAKMADDPNVVEDGRNNLNTGVGVIFQYDTRDVPVNAFKGLFFEARVTGYGSWLDEPNFYLTTHLDIRHYITVGKRPGSTFAWNIQSYLEFWKTPWSELPLVGSPFDLRGYYWGRFRDQQATYLIGEYRYHFPTKRPGRQYSRSGVVVWAGLGFVGDNFLEAPILPNVGVGYRFEVQPRMNLRVDFGFGAFDSFGFYISFLEAF